MRKASYNQPKKAQSDDGFIPYFPTKGHGRALCSGYDVANDISQSGRNRILVRSTGKLDTNYKWHGGEIENGVKEMDRGELGDSKGCRHSPI